jgi:hypothetical protein
MGLMSVLIGYSIIGYGLPSLLGFPSNGLEFYLASFLNGSVAFAAIFYWVDASILAARRSDPLLRDTLKWTRLRPVYWAVILVSFVSNIVASFYLLATVGVLPYGFTYSGPVYIVWMVSNYPVIVGPALAGVVAMPIIAYRSRDMTLRRHFKWFGLGFVFFIAFFVLLGALVSVGIAPVVTLTGTAYCMYRSARSLAPLNRIATD